MTRLFIAGIPGAGKSCFADWLHREHGFNHLDVDHHQPTDAELSEENVVMDWGFPPNDQGFATVRWLLEPGFEGWWFDGDRDAAFESYMSGEKPKLAGEDAARHAWDTQLCAIEGRWDEIASLFEGRMLNVVSPGPTHMSNEDRYRAIQRND